MDKALNRRLNDISAIFRPTVFEFLARLTEAGIPVMIVNTLRTLEEQKQNIANGVSWTLNSKHLPQLPDSKSLAIDICPYAQFALHGPDKLMWDTSDPAWEKIVTIGESLGMVAGARWKVRDMGHFEYKGKPPQAKSDDFVA